MPAAPGDQILAEYRVLVLRDDDEPKARRVVAVCLEQNLTGQGSTVPAALSSLSASLKSSIDEELLGDAMAYRYDPDPELVAAFDSDAKRTPDGAVILSRYRLGLAWEVLPVAAESRSQRRAVSAPAAKFELCQA